MVQIDLKLVIGQFLDAMNRVRESWAKFSEDSKKAAAEAAKAFDQTTKKTTEAGDAAKKTATSANETAIVLSRMYGVMADSTKGVDQAKSSKFYEFLVNLSGAFRNMWSAAKAGDFSKVFEILKSNSEVKSLAEAFQLLSSVLKSGGVSMAQASSALEMIGPLVAALGPEVLIAAGAFAALAGAGAGLFALSKVVKSLTQDMADLSSRAREIGVAASEMYTLEKSFEAIGSTALDAGTGLERFFTKLSEARFGSGETAAALRRLSIASGQDLKPIELLKAGNVQAFYQVVNALRSVRNEAQQVEIASKLFTGKTGPEIKAIIDTGALDNANVKFAAFKSVISEVGGKFSDTNMAATTVFTAIKDGIMLVVNSFASLSQAFFAGFEAMGGTEAIANGFGSIAEAISRSMPLVDVALAAVGGILGILAQAFAGVAKLISGVIALMRGLQNAILSVLAAIFEALNGITFGLLSRVTGVTGDSIRNIGKKLESGSESAKGTSGFMPVEAFKPMQIAIASSLTKVGGGGESFGAGGNDPLYDIARLQLETQKEIVYELKRSNSIGVDIPNEKYYQAGANVYF